MATTKAKKSWNKYDAWYGLTYLGSTWAKSPQQAANNVCHRYNHKYPYDGIVAEIAPANGTHIYPYEFD